MENLGKHCGEWPAGKADSQIKLLIQERKRQAARPHSVHRRLSHQIPDQSGWGFTVKQGATIIHEDNVAYTVSTSSLTMVVEAVIHALRWIALRSDGQTTHAIILTDSMSLPLKVKSETGSPEGHVSMFDIHLRELLWVYCLGHAGVKGNDRADLSLIHI